jgi:hypothetical protein
MLGQWLPDLSILWSTEERFRRDEEYNVSAYSI